MLPQLGVAPSVERLQKTGRHGVLFMSERLETMHTINGAI